MVTDEAIALLQLRPEAASEKRALFRDAASALELMADGATETGQPVACLWVPGRIEFLGKHTDYAGGRSLLCTIERGVCVAVRPRRDARVRVLDATSRETVECALDPDLPTAVRGWGIYPSTVVRRVARNFPDSRIGADIAFRSDLPMAAGISSSSALVVSIFLALSAVNALPERLAYRTNLRSREDLAGYLGCIESGFDFGTLVGDSGVGTLSGCEDQTAMICSTPGSLVQYSFCPVRFEGVAPLPRGHSFVIATSGVVAEKTASALEKYNRLSRRARAGASVLRSPTGSAYVTLADAVREMDPDAIRATLGRMTADGFPSEELVDRFDQFHLESELIVPRAADALRSGDLVELGSLVDQSQAAVEQLLGNQIAETISLARSARALGAVAGSAFGAGFGGSVWALVEDPRLAAFVDEWRERYLTEFPAHRSSASFFVTRAAAAAMRLT
jgi:galactokinase